MASNNASRSDQLVLADVLATEALGANLARLWLGLPLDSRPILLLEGDLGAGKTSLVQGLAAGLGIGLGESLGDDADLVVPGVAPRRGGEGAARVATPAGRAPADQAAS